MRAYVSQARLREIFPDRFNMNAQFIAYLLAVIAAELIGGLSPMVRDWSYRGLILPVSFSGGVLLGAITPYRHEVCPFFDLGVGPMVVTMRPIP